MAKAPKKIDPTKDPQFQSVVQHFLKTPPKPRKIKPTQKPKPKKKAPEK